jgi:DMSO/TMAO reductase YedYZ molybdopterin-dependent catalytic subunit
MQEERRRFIQRAAAGTVLGLLGGLYVLLDEHPAYAETRRDGRPRVPPGQRVLAQLRDMGGAEGDPSKSAWKLKIHGEVDSPFELDFRALTQEPQITAEADVHCVTGWSVIGHRWTGVKLADLAKRAGVRDEARFVIFEAAHGYTANIPLREALRPNVMLVHRMNDAPLPREHGTPVRALVPDLYFWKSAKWLSAIRFSSRDRPGYWEKRGYHNRGNPWNEERFG